MDISGFADCRVLVAGDLMLDEYVWGEASRISPEAPVPVVAVKKDNYTAGGAGNVANNLAALGAQVLITGIIGTGEYGRHLLDLFESKGIDTRGIIQEEGRPTTRKTRVIAGSQHVLRIDRETASPVLQNTHDRVLSFIESCIQDVDIVLISDYAKGFLTPPFLSSLISLADKYKKPSIADPKGRRFSKYSGVSLLTPNQKEAALASGIEISDKNSLLTAGKELLESADIKRLLITRSSEGMTLFHPDHTTCDIKAVARQVFDVSGAGDTVLSVLGLAIASGFSYEESAKCANAAAGIVVGKVGTATVTADELKAALSPFSGNNVKKHKSLDNLSREITVLKEKGKKIVMTNGCFDLLHAGHIMLFSASKNMGDVLVVAIDDDESIRQIKGSGRPVIGLTERLRVLDALDSIDYLTVFSKGKIDDVISAVRPDILTKGSNYSPDQVTGHELVEKYEGEVILIPVSEKTSSSGIINHIRKMNPENGEIKNGK